MQTQYNVLGYRIHLYVYDYKLAIEVDEMVIVTEILAMKLKDKKQYNKNLVVSLLQLILTKITLIN